MREVLTERDITPWRRTSNTRRFTASVLAAGLAGTLAYAGIGMFETVPSQPKWTAEVPDEFGDPILAQLSDERIAITSQQGLTILDAQNGKRVWQHEIAAEALGVFDGELNFATAPAVTHVIGDTVLVTEYEKSETMLFEASPSKITGFDLHTGSERFSIVPPEGVQMEGSVTQSTIAIRQCADPYEPECSLEAYDLDDGQPKWSFDGEFTGDDLSFPAPLRNSIQTGQTDLVSMVMEPAAVPRESYAVLTERDTEESDFDQPVNDVTAININTGAQTTWRDTAESHEDESDYIPMNDWLLRIGSDGLWVMDPATGNARHQLSLHGSYATDGTSLDSQPGVLADGDTLLDIEADDDGMAIEGVSSYQILDPEAGQARSQHSVDGLMVGANDDTVVTMSDTEENPLMRGIDAETGEQEWSKRLYPEWAEASGLQTKAMLMRDGLLAMSGTPRSWNSEYIEGAIQTRVVSLSDGRTEVLDNVTAMGLSGDGLLGYVHASEDDDTPARLAYYPV